MSISTQAQKDRWSTEAYTNAASFVPALANTVTRYLSPQSTDRILDIGCGDGVLSAKIAAQCKEFVGLDSSASMIGTATKTVTSKHANTDFRVADCRRLPLGNGDDAVVSRDSFDKVFSNAAMHWILTHMKDRTKFFRDVFAALKPGGKFVFEMGGHHNIAELHSTAYAVLHLKYGVPMERIRAADPWFFPSENWMRGALEAAGFMVEIVEVEFRPTKCTDRAEDGSGGLEGWIRLMMSIFLDLIEDDAERNAAVKDICTALDHVETRIEDGSQWLSYVRLRGVAKKPE